MDDKKYQKQLALVEAAKAKKQAFVLHCKRILTEQHFVETDDLFIENFEHATLVPSPFVYEADFMLQLDKLPLYCVLLAASHDNPEVRYFGHAEHLFGYLQTTVDYGHILITPKSSEQKIVSFFIKQHSNYTADKQFLKKFLIEEANANKSVHSFPPAFTQSLMAFDELHLEFKGHYCFFLTSLKGLSAEECNRFITLSGILLNHLVKL
jgi:hypothetical protein